MKNHVVAVRVLCRTLFLIFHIDIGKPCRHGAHVIYIVMLEQGFAAIMATSTTITVQPGAMMAPHTKITTWSTGLCDCCEDMSICCFGFWCPCCLMCTTSQEFGECLCLPLLDICFGTIIPPATYSVRSAMRERYRIQGTMCDDCCVATCCGICAWCQMARELKHRRQPQVFVNPPVNVTYQTPVNTSYQPVVNQSYQQPPINPAYQPLQPDNPPIYAQPSKSTAPPGTGLYPAV